MNLLTKVKMSKLAILIMRPGYSYKKQIKTDYKAQLSTNLMFNGEIRRRKIKLRKRT
jgi:Trm5-related predicted tRNA methylase